MATETLSTYDPWITTKKMIFEGFIVGAIAFLTYIVDIGLPGLALDYPQYATVMLTVSAIVTGIINWIKHRKDTTIVEK